MSYKSKRVCIAYSPRARKTPSPPSLYLALFFLVTLMPKLPKMLCYSSDFMLQVPENCNQSCQLVFFRLSQNLIMEACCIAFSKHCYISKWSLYKGHFVMILYVRISLMYLAYQHENVANPLLFIVTRKYNCL